MFKKSRLAAFQVQVDRAVRFKFGLIEWFKKIASQRFNFKLIDCTFGALCLAHAVRHSIPKIARIPGMTTV